MPRASREADIREAALGCFARLGYDGTRVRHVAEEAGVSDAAQLADAAAGAGPVRARLGGVVARMLDLYGDRPHLSVFLIEQQPRFIGALPARFPYPLHVIEGLVAEGQKERTVKRGDARLLAAMALGCVTRPILVSRYSQRWSLDPADRAQRKLIATGAWDAIRRPG
jgi:AcrR family transcriptional regulator